MEKVKIIASALIKKDNKVLAIKLSEDGKNDIYITPGGRPEFGETLRDCAIREAREEVGVDIEIIKVAGILEKAYEDGIWTIIYYQAEIKKGEAINGEPEEIKSVDWINIEDLASFKDIKWLN